MRINVIALTMSVAAHLCLGCSDCRAQPKKVGNITPDAEIQKLMRKIVNEPDDTNKLWLDESKKIKNLARIKPEVLGPQLVYFSANGKTENEWVAEVYLMWILERDTELQAPIIPLLESDDPSVRKAAANWLTLFNRQTTGSRELLGYSDALRKNKETPPPGLVAYLFETSPGEALILFGRLDSKDFSIRPRPFVWVDHVVTTVAWRQDKNFLQKGDLEMVRNELDALSKHERWYARRYVAEIIAKHRELGTPEIVERLSKDSHPLVKAGKMK